MLSDGTSLFRVRALPKLTWKRVSELSCETSIHGIEHEV